MNTTARNVVSIASAVALVAYIVVRISTTPMGGGVVSYDLAAAVPFAAVFYLYGIDEMQSLGGGCMRIVTC